MCAKSVNVIERIDEHCQQTTHRDLRSGAHLKNAEADRIGSDRTVSQPIGPWFNTWLNSKMYAKNSHLSELLSSACGKLHSFKINFFVYRSSAKKYKIFNTITAATPAGWLPGWLKAKFSSTLIAPEPKHDPTEWKFDCACIHPPDGLQHTREQLMKARKAVPYLLASLDR